MTVVITLLAIAVSCAGIAYLAATDVKRRRVFSLPAMEPKHRALAWTLVYLPGLFLLIFDQWAATMMWLGGMPLAGWIMVIIPPQAYAQAHARLLAIRAQLENFKALFGSTPRQSAVHYSDQAAARIAELEGRIAELETQLARQQKSQSNLSEKLPA